MHLILNARSSNSEYNADCDYAVVELTPAFAEEIRSRVSLARKAKQQDSELYELYFWGSTADFFDNDILDVCQDVIALRTSDQAARDWLADLEGREYAVVPDGVDLNAHEPQRTECGQMIIRICPSSREPEFEIAWTTIPKHSDVYVTTCDLPLAAMEELLAAPAAQPAT